MNIIAIAMAGAVLLTACGMKAQPPLRDTGSAVLSSQSAGEEESLMDAGSAYVTEGGEVYEDFVLDNVLHSDEHADIHYNLYIPQDYDGSRTYALFMTLPGWEGLYFQGVGENIRWEKFGAQSRNYHTDMTVVAPQLSGWGETSAEEAIALTEYFLSHYNIDRERVYINGFSGGGETLFWMLGKHPELFTAALHCASQWDGDLTVLARSRTPLYLAIGEGDEYYGPESVQCAYQTLRDLYRAEGLTEEEISELVVLDVKDQQYFSARGQSNQHGGSGQFAFDEAIMGWFFGDHGEPVEAVDGNNRRILTPQTKVSDVMFLPVFQGFGQFLFPTQRGGIDGGMALSDVGRLLPYHDHIRTETTIDVLTAMENAAASGEPIFYDIYSEEEKAADPSKDHTGLFFFRGDADVACEDLAAAISFVFAHAGELGVSTDCYSLWGGSAGARMAAYLGSYGPAAFGGDDLPRPGAVIMQYTGHSDYTENDPPTYVCVGENDGIANWRTMEQRVNRLKALGIETEFHKYPGLGHGFGLGIGTSAAGWLEDAAAFWKRQIRKEGAST